MTCALTRDRIAVVTELSAVARKPTIRRLACGPISTLCDRTGLNSAAANTGTPNAIPRSAAYRMRPHGLFICLMPPSVTILTRLDCELWPQNLSGIMPVSTPEAIDGHPGRSFGRIAL